jgi:protease I
MPGKNAVILVEDVYEDLEFWYPYYRLKEDGYEVTIVAPKKHETYTSKHGYPVTSEATPGEIEPRSVSVLIVPGGFAPDKLRRDKSILSLVRDTFESGAIIGTICHAAWVAISAGITKGKKMTCVSAIKDDLVNSGAEYVDEALVVDGNVITSRTPADLPVFVKGILDAV